MQINQFKNELKDKDFLISEVERLREGEDQSKEIHQNYQNEIEKRDTFID